MGLYINPPNETKEDFLAREGLAVPAPNWPPLPGESWVCLVDNWHFSAAAVAHNEEEMNAFLVPDKRPKMWFSVPTRLLPKVTGDDFGYYFPEFETA